MKRKIVTSLLFVIGISLSACSIRENSFFSQSNEPESFIVSDASAESLSSDSSVESLSSDSSSSGFSYSFENKESGLTLEQITEEINQIDPQPEERKKVRYTWHIEEILTGLYPKVMLDDTQMPEGKIVGEFVSEPRNHNLDTNI